MSQHPLARRLLRDIERYMRFTDTTQTEFGRTVLNDGNFVPRLRRGRTPKLETIDKVRRYLDERVDGKPQR